MIDVPERVVERLKSGVLEDKSSGCWVWQGAVEKDGYGVVYFREYGKFRKVLAHRLSFEIHHHLIPDGKCVCHSCDLPACINPDHLWLGSHGENHADRDQKGRQAKGQQHGRSKLTDSDVLQIYKLLRTGYSAYAISKRFPISHTQAWEISRGKAWAHLFHNLGV